MREDNRSRRIANEARRRIELIAKRIPGARALLRPPEQPESTADRLVVISDTHFGNEYAALEYDRALEELIGTLEELGPIDELVLLGDIFDGSTPMFPVWASDYSILFRACNYWQDGGTCGIWKADSGMTRAGRAPETPPALIVADNAVPTDTKGGNLVYMSRATGNWDVYVTPIGGGSGVNITDNPADDGLGTISPDGKWVAFVSNRDGRWGVWVVPTDGGAAERLPIDIPGWIDSYGGWTVERISWGR